jgi:hypothetical protein
MGGGPLRDLGSKVGLRVGTCRVIYLGLAIALLTWVPLLVLTAAANTFWSGPTVPFVQSLGTHVRLLVVIPLMFVAEAAFDLRVQHLIRAIVAAQLVPRRQLPLLDAALRQAKAWRDSRLIEGVFVIIAILTIWGGFRADLPGDVTTWRTTPAGRPSLAGSWYGLVSLPLFLFLGWRWVMRLVIWCHLLSRIRGMDLQLLPAHPDRSGGLGGLGGGPDRRSCRMDEPGSKISPPPRYPRLRRSRIILRARACADALVTVGLRSSYRMPW